MALASLTRRHLLMTAAVAATFPWLSGGQASSAPTKKSTSRINRKALVQRHNPVLTKIDPTSPLMLGNGNIGFTADITGLQTFTEPYDALAPLLTEAQWAWHSFPNPQGYTVKDTQVAMEVDGHARRYGYIKDWAEATSNPAMAYIRENSHRFSLGRISLDLRGKDGTPARFADLSDLHQGLDLWTGTLTSRFVYDGQPVTVTTRVLGDQDTILAEVVSPLVAQGRLAVRVRYPGVAKTLNPDPADWSNPDSHVTTELSRRPGELRLKRQIDSTIYYAAIGASTGAKIDLAAPHDYRISADGAGSVSVQAQFSIAPGAPLPTPAIARREAEAHWTDYWSQGGMVEFAGSSDPRAPELERRVILSQYLMAINGAGAFPPQEEGLFSNSWNGKSHLEMHPWHSAHFALWGRPQLLERGLTWYLTYLPQAKARATEQGVKGAWWPKMVGPDGADSPSKVSPFIMWQQPHPIYMCELIYRAAQKNGGKRVLDTYGELVAETADLLASFVVLDDKTGRYRLGPPVIPVQENHDPFVTYNPAFEVAYFRWGIETAQAWRVRAGQARRADWDAVLAKWPDLAQQDGLYLPAASTPDFWDKAASDLCRANAVDASCMNSDHPSVLMPLGWLPGQDVDKAVMRRTLDRVRRDWDLRQTWGWDYPMIAMTATRLKAPAEAVDWLFFTAKNNQFGTSGMTPRIHLDAAAMAFVPKATGAGGNATPSGDGPDGHGYQRAAETYFPSNGGLLLAVALMAGGWDGEAGHAPGFPAGWSVKAEGLLSSI